MAGEQGLTKQRLKTVVIVLSALLTVSLAAAACFGILALRQRKGPTSAQKEMQEKIASAEEELKARQSEIEELKADLESEKTESAKRQASIVKLAEQIQALTKKATPKPVATAPTGKPGPKKGPPDKKPSPPPPPRSDEYKQWPATVKVVILDEGKSALTGLYDSLRKNGHFTLSVSGVTKQWRVEDIAWWRKTEPWWRKTEAKRGKEEAHLERKPHCLALTGPNQSGLGRMTYATIFALDGALRFEKATNADIQLLRDARLDGISYVELSNPNTKKRLLVIPTKRPDEHIMLHAKHYESKLVYTGSAAFPAVLAGHVKHSWHVRRPTFVKIAVSMMGNQMNVTITFEKKMRKKKKQAGSKGKEAQKTEKEAPEYIPIPKKYIDEAFRKGLYLRINNTGVARFRLRK